MRGQRVAEQRARVFVDFWNFQLHWNDHTNKQPCNWARLPGVLVRQAADVLTGAGLDGALRLDEARVYASVDPANPGEQNLRRWLDSFLDRQPSFRVFRFDRRERTRPARCRLCGWEVRACQECGKPLVQRIEKGVDTALATDLLSLAWEGTYDVAVLVTCDADLVPAVERLQERGAKVINATWEGLGHELAKACWASFDIVTVADSLIRPA